MLRPDRMIRRAEVRRVITEGEVIEEYPKDARGHSCLLLGFGDRERPIYVVCAPREDYLAIITAYLPDAHEGYTLEKLADRVAGVLGLEPKDLGSVGKYAKNVRARSVFCYWAVRELGWSATEVARRIGITQPAVSISVKRGEPIAKEMELKITEL